MMAQIEKLARPRVDVLMMQMSIIQGIQKIGNKGNDMLTYLQSDINRVS